MVKKLLILSLVAVMLSTAALANGILLAESTYAADVDAIVEVENNATISEETGLEGTVTLNLASTEARDSALLITAVYDNSGAMLNAEINSEVTSVVAGDNAVTIDLPSARTDENDKYIVKFFWWEDKASLVPVVECASITVLPPAPEAPAAWTGVAATEAEAPDQDANGYYLIENGEDLAWFSNKVDEDATVKAKLENDIYLNWFDADANGVFDENWYETAANVEAATSWTATNNAADASFCISGFAGEFDGQNNTIYGLYMQGGTGTGFFSSVSGGTVKNVTFKGAYLVSTTQTSASGLYKNTADYKPVAVVAAQAIDTASTSNFNNIIVSGKITATAQGDILTAAAIVGRIDSTVNITDCTSYVDIIDSAKTFPTTSSTASGPSVAVVKCGVAGIVGMVGNKNSGATGRTATLTRCYNYGNIIVPYTNSRISGVVGHVRNGILDLTSTCGNAGKIRSLKTGTSQMYGYKSGDGTVKNTTNQLTGGSMSTYAPDEEI